METQTAIEEKLKELAKNIIKARYSDVFRTIDGLLLKVREPLTDEGGNVQYNSIGRVRYKREENGNFIVNYEKLTDNQLQDFLFEITIAKFDLSLNTLDLENNSIVKKLLYDKEKNQRIINTTGINAENRQAQVYLSTEIQRWDKIVADYTKTIIRIINDELRQLIYIVERILSFRASSEKLRAYSQKK
jgi:hypothetical protein